MLPWTFISTHLVLPVWKEIVCHLTRQRRTPAALNAPLSVETCLFWQQPVICPPPFCVWSSCPCGGCFLIFAKPHGFPAFHHSPSHVGRSANSTLLRGRGLKLHNSLGLELRPEFPPSPSAAPDPTPFLPQSLQAIWDVPHLLHRAVCTLLTWSQSSQAPPGTWPLLHCPQKPQGPGSPETKHDLVMSYSSVCVCIIRAKGWSYVMAQCKLTVLVCKKSEGLQLTSILKLPVCWGTFCEGVQLPFVKSKIFSLSAYTTDSAC